MGSSFSGPANPNDQFFVANENLELSGPPVPPDQVSVDGPDGLPEDDVQESGAAAGGE